MWIICIADDSHEMSRLIFFEKQKRIKNIVCCSCDDTLKVNVCNMSFQTFIYFKQVKITDGMTYFYQKLQIIWTISLKLKAIFCGKKYDKNFKM